MDEYDKFTIKQMKEKLINVLESGKITDSEMQYDMVENILLQLMFVKNKKINDTIIQYFEDQEKLKLNIEDKRKELQKSMDEYSDNVKEIYENTIKKL